MATQRQMDEALKAFASDMLVDVGLQSDVITLSFLNPDPQVAHAVVQSMLDHFFSQEAVIYANPQLQFSQDEAKRAQEKLAAAQKALSQFRQANKISDLTAPGQSVAAAAHRCREQVGDGEWRRAGGAAEGGGLQGIAGLRAAAGDHQCAPAKPIAASMKWTDSSPR